MPRASREETMAAALRELDAGVKVPVIHQKYGISDRTLYRWRRGQARARAKSGVALRPHPDLPIVAVLEGALRVVVALLSPEQRVRAMRALESELGTTRAEARRLLELADAPAPGGARVGMALSRPGAAAPLAEEFGKAHWLGVHVPPDGFQVVQNVGRSGVAAATALRDAGCQEVITLHLGARALERLTTAGLRIWRGHAGTPARELVAALARGELGGVAFGPRHARAAAAEVSCRGRNFGDNVPPSPSASDAYRRRGGAGTRHSRCSR